MGHIRLEQALQALKNTGLGAHRGYPGGKLPSLTEPVAALWMHKVTDDGATVAAQVFCPPHLGGAVCEDAALEAMEALKGIGAACQLSACQYDRATGYYCVQVLGGWYAASSTEDSGSVPEQLRCSVSVNGRALPYLTGFSAERTEKLEPQMQLCAGAGGIYTETGYWTLWVEELLPHGATMAQSDVYDFTLTVTRSDGTENYPLCRWEKVQRQEVPGGVKQVRIARTWAERSQHDA